MSSPHIEVAFEEQIENSLLENGGYHRGDAREFDRERALFPADVIRFIRKTQAKEWQQLEKLHAKGTADVILHDLVKALTIQGSLATLRHGFKCFGRPLRMAYFKPATGSTKKPSGYMLRIA